MPALQPPSLPATTSGLNKTPLSLHVASLFETAKASPEPGLLLVAILFWAMTGLQDHDPELLTELAGNAAESEQANPRRTYEELALPELETASTLEEAARQLVRHLQPA